MTNKELTPQEKEAACLKEIKEVLEKYGMVMNINHNISIGHKENGTKPTE